MKRLTKEQIEEIKKLRKEKGILEVARTFKVNPNTIKYHTDIDFKNKLITYNRVRYQKMNKEQREEYLDKKREYQKNYHRERYNNDPHFRNNHLESVRKSRQSKGGKQK